MFEPCRAFREARFEPEARDRSGPSAEHLEQCAECRAWSLGVEQREQRLSALPKQAAPEGLANAVWGEIAFPEVRVARAVSSLERLQAPAELDARVTELLAPGRLAAGSVEGLTPARAPQVLDRLVQEELADPEGHRARRFVGALEPVKAPGSLARRLSALRGTRPGSGPRRLAAAALVVVAVGFFAWMLRGESGVEPPVRRLPLVAASSPEELDPLARGLALALGGWESR